MTGPGPLVEKLQLHVMCSTFHASSLSQVTMCFIIKLVSALRGVTKMPKKRDNYGNGGWVGPGLTRNFFLGGIIPKGQFRGDGRTVRTLVFGVYKICCITGSYLWVI